MNEIEVLPAFDGNLIVRHREGDETAFAVLAADLRVLDRYLALLRGGTAAEAWESTAASLQVAGHRYMPPKEGHR